MKKATLVDQIDALLPQTQCGLCNYPGCRPYAQAIANKEATIDHCPPGGVATLKALANLLDIDAQPFVVKVKQQSKVDSVVVIREAECIGCTKCLQVCPTDAIIGSRKKMHTVIAAACTGCELCLPACPVDCIDIIDIAARNTQEKQQKAKEWRQRYQQREQRITRLAAEKKQRHLNAKGEQHKNETLAKRQAAIAAAIERSKAKKSS